MGRDIRKPSNYKSKIQQTQGRTVRDLTDSRVSSGTDTPLLPDVTLQNQAMEMERQFVRGNRAFSGTVRFSSAVTVPRQKMRGRPARHAVWRAHRDSICDFVVTVTKSCPPIFRFASGRRGFVTALVKFKSGHYSFSFWRQSRWGGAMISEDFRFPGLAEPKVGK
jgi:hypothetical protein